MSSKKTSVMADQLLSVVCHDLANPLTVLAFNLEILNSTSMDPTSELSYVRLQRCLSAVHKVRAIVEMVRQTHALRLGKLEISREPVSLRKCLMEVFDEYQLRAIEKKTRFILCEWADQDQVFCDPRLLTAHILSNLVSNAIKFSPRSGEIYCGTRQTRSGLIFYISDCGDGIPERKIGQLFDFHSMTTTTGSANEKGSGLGLPIVQFFLSQIGADIKVHSRFKKNQDPLHGTLFEIHFPYVMSEKRNTQV
jgi:signal transduction histidine kinase